MSNLTVSRNGRLAKRNRAYDGFPVWGSLLSELWGDQVDLNNQSNFHEGISAPKVNILEKEDSFEVQVAAPGLKKQDFSINVENEELSISAKVEQTEESKEENFTRREFGYASFKRSFLLPETVDGDKIQAKYEDGVLNITLPKKEEAKPKPARTIEIG